MKTNKLLVGKHIRFTRENVEKIEMLIKKGRYQTFSEFVRKAVRKLLEEEMRRV